MFAAPISGVYVPRTATQKTHAETSEGVFNEALAGAEMESETDVETEVGNDDLDNDDLGTDETGEAAVLLAAGGLLQPASLFEGDTTAAVSDEIIPAIDAEQETVIGQKQNYLHPAHSLETAPFADDASSDLPSAIDPRVHTSDPEHIGMERAKISIEEQLGKASSQTKGEQISGEGDPNAELSLKLSKIFHRAYQNADSGLEAKTGVKGTPGEYLTPVEESQEELHPIDDIRQTRLLRQALSQKHADSIHSAALSKQNAQSTPIDPMALMPEKGVGLHSPYAVHNVSNHTSAQSAVLTAAVAEAALGNEVQDKSELGDAALSETSFDSLYRDLNEGKVKITNTIRSTDPVTSARETVNDAPLELDQIVSKIRVNQNGTQEITMELSPAELGKMTMKVHQEGGQLNVEMRVDSSHAKHLIENSLSELKARFIEKDFSFEQMNLSVNIDDRSSSQFSQADQGQYQEDYVAGKQRERLAAETPVIETIRRPVSQSGLSLYA